MISAMKSGQVFAFVMAGGSGERFWPMSRQSTPKHLLRLLDDRTLLETTVRRLEGLVPLENTFILTNAAQLESTKAAVPFLPEKNIIAEPAKRDTAPACALATAIARALDPEAVCIVLPADAMIHDTARFRSCLSDAADLAARTGTIATLGIPPAFPATGYGYLETAGSLPDGPQGSAIHTLRRFVEKPDLDKAREYTAAGNFLWNAGIFVWRASAFLEEARRQLPPLAEFIESLAGIDDLPSHLANRFAPCRKFPSIMPSWKMPNPSPPCWPVLIGMMWEPGPHCPRIFRQTRTATANAGRSFITPPTTISPYPMAASSPFAGLTISWSWKLPTPFWFATKNPCRMSKPCSLCFPRR
jgi:mannose-1-phosphate guanylyltransferase